jgi:hypothetical protein
VLKKSSHRLQRDEPLCENGTADKTTGRCPSGHTRVAWRKRSVIRRNCIRIKDEERIQKVRMLIERVQKKERE